MTDTAPLYKLEEIAAILRAEKGCAWDRKQTPDSLKPYLIEEAYEVYDAIEKGDSDNLKEELGDLLYQVYFHAQIAKEEGRFTIDDVADEISQKLIRRHPHVFGNDSVKDADEVTEKWEKIKKKEKAGRKHHLDGVPQHLPALLMAFRVQEKVSRLGFDWEHVHDAMEKLDEEIAEMKDALLQNDREALIDEAGDLLFSIVNTLRHLKVEPEEALRRSVNRFRRRFNEVENEAAARKQEIEAMSPDELESLWKLAKDRLRQEP